MVFMSLLIREPLICKGRPVKGMKEKEIIVIWCLFFPYFVFLVYDHFLLLIELFRHNFDIIIVTNTICLLIFLQSALNCRFKRPFSL